MGLQAPLWRPQSAFSLTFLHHGVVASVSRAKLSEYVDGKITEDPTHLHGVTHSITSSYFTSPSIHQHRIASGQYLATETSSPAHNLPLPPTSPAPHLLQPVRCATVAQWQMLTQWEQQCESQRSTVLLHMLRNATHVHIQDGCITTALRGFTNSDTTSCCHGKRTNTISFLRNKRITSCTEQEKILSHNYSCAQ